MTADNTVSIGFEINGNGEQVTKSVKSIKTELREATQDAVNLSRKFGEFSPQALDAAKKVANLKDEVADFKARVDALNPDAKFRAFSSALQGVAGGFAGVQGAIGLFGTESKELEKQLLKVQSALALSEGLNSVLEAGDSFKNLGSIIQTRVVTAFSTLKGAIIATGLGALAVALGTIVVYWDEISDAITGATKETKAYGDAQKEANKEIEKGYENLIAVENAFNAARDGAISKSAALDIYNEKLGTTIGKAETLEQAERIYRANSVNYIKSVSARATAQILLTKAAQASAKAAIGEDVDLSLLDKISLGITAVTTLGFGAEAKLGELRSKNRKANASEIEFYQNLALKQLEEAGKAENEIQKVAVANGTNIVKEGVKSQTSIKKQGTQEEQTFGEKLGAKEISKVEGAKLEIQANNELLTNKITTDEMMLQGDALFTQLSIENSSKRIQSLQAENQAKIAIQQEYVNVVAQFGDLLQGIAGKNKALAIAGVIISQGAAIGEILTRTASGIAGATATAAPFLSNPVTAPLATKNLARTIALAKISAGIGIAGAIAGAAKGIAQINKANVPGGDSGGNAGGGGGAGGIQAPIAQGVAVQQTSSVGTSNVNIKNTDAIKAYVVERDITDSQDRINKIKAAATFGG